MDEKHLNHNNQYPSSSPEALPSTTTMPIRQRRHLRPALGLVILFAVAYLLLTGAVPRLTPPVSPMHNVAVQTSELRDHMHDQTPPPAMVVLDGDDGNALRAGELVPLEAHIMSKCNDAQVCAGGRGLGNELLAAAAADRPPAVGLSQADDSPRHAAGLR